MDFHLLGPVEVVDDGRAIPLGGSKQRALLALLALQAGRAVSPDRLIDELWGSRPPATAAKALQVHVSRLRSSLAADVIQTRADGYALAADPDRVDAIRFERLIAAAPRAADVARAVEHALALWRGTPLADLAHEPFARPHIARLQELRLRALELRTEALLARGRHDELIAELEALIAQEPYRERLRAQLMIALYRGDRQADALAAFQSARRTLRDELGLEPGERLRELQRSILAQSPELAAPRADPEPVLPHPLQFPADAPFAGRAHELARLRERWATGGCVFVAGEAGIGKTRLAARFARSAHGGTVLYGRCDEQLAAPYAPFADALGETVLAGGEPSDRGRRALFNAVAKHLADADRPTLLVLDDLQWADAPSLALLRHLVRTGTSRTLILALYRDGALDRLWAEERPERLTLAGLDTEEIAALLPAPDRAFADRLLAETGGNPFFVGELIAHTGESTPASLREVILARAHRLSRPAQSVLTTAAVIGVEFSVGALEGVHAEHDLLDALDEASAAGLIGERGHGDYEFKHALVRRALYDDLSAARRARLHARVGETLEAGPAATVQDLAHHFAEAADAGHAAKAADYALAAGREAIRRGGHEQAAAHYRRGLRALEREGDAHAARRRELIRQLRLTRYEPLPRVGAIPGWLWGRLPRAGQLAVAAGAVALLALAAAVTPGIVRAHRDRVAAEAGRDRRERAATLASINAEQRPHPGRGPAAGSDAAARDRLVAAVASSIRADGVRRGEAIVRVECEPYAPGGDGALTCLAVTADAPPTARSPAQSQGHPYRANVTFATGRFAFCRISPRATKVLRADTPLPATCGGDAPAKVQGQPG
jgi:DNA-binding SARP family transcriptional activator